MKNRKWLTYTLGTLLTLIVLAAVAVASFRIGMMQNASFVRPAFARNFNNAPLEMQKNFQDDKGSQGMQGNPHDNGWNEMRGNRQNRGFDGRGGMPFFAPIFGLIRLAVLGLILWGIYMLVKKSGWRLTRVEATPAPAPDQNDSVEEVGKKKRQSR